MSFMYNIVENTLIVDDSMLSKMNDIMKDKSFNVKFIGYQCYSNDDILDVSVHLKIDESYGIGFVLNPYEKLEYKRFFSDVIRSNHMYRIRWDGKAVFCFLGNLREYQFRPSSITAIFNLDVMDEILHTMNVYKQKDLKNDFLKKVQKIIYNLEKKRRFF